MKVIDIANFFVSLGTLTPENDLTNLKLQKLLYFTQGWSLVLFNKPAFDEPIEAWEFGPVVPTVYSVFKKYNKNVIDKIYKTYNENVFTDDELDLLLTISAEYNQYSAYKLVNMTHQNDTAWSIHYQKEKHQPIALSSIKTEFTHKLPIKLCSTTIKEYNQKKEQIGYRDEKTGHYVLPADWDDGEDYSIYLRD